MSSANQSAKQPSSDIYQLEVRQHLLEDCTFLDIPVEILCDPPPNPRQFIYLQRYYDMPSGIKKELKECESAEAAIDILANELEGMRHLLSGYVNNFSKYVAKFDADHEETRKEHESIAESYTGVLKIVKETYLKAQSFHARFESLEKKLSQIHTLRRPPPRIIRREGGAGLKNPKMTPEEQLTTQQRRAEHLEDLEKTDFVNGGKETLQERGRLAELVHPPVLQPSPPTNQTKKHTEKSKSKGKGKQRAVAAASAPLDPRVSVKVEKLADGLVKMREALQRVQQMAERDLTHMRLLTGQEKRNTSEIWAVHDIVDHRAFAAGKIMKMTARRVEAYDRWATQCLEDQASAAVPPAESQPATTQASAPTPSRPSTSVPSDGTTTSSLSSQDAPPTSEDVYAVVVDLKCEKKLEELTRAEAITLLKALPLRIHFTPNGSPVDEPMVEDNTSRVHLEGPVPTTEQDAYQVSTQTQHEPAEVGAPGTSEETPSTSGQPQLAEKPASIPKTLAQKRGRSSEDAELNHGEEDSRIVVGGSPAKKKRV